MSVATGVGLDPRTLLAGLLRIPSVTGRVGDAAAVLVRIASDAGYAAARDGAGNVLMSWGNAGASEEIILLGHLDTVPGDLQVREDDGRLYGRGAVDAKGPLAAALAAVSRLPPDEGRCITVIAACDEEGPSLGARHLRNRRAPAHLIVLEPSGWDTITTGYRGCVRLTLGVSQPSAHHAGPEAGAADRLLTLLAELRRSIPTSADRAVDRVQLRVNSLSGRDDGDRERAGAEVEVRIPSGVTAGDIAARVRTLAGAVNVDVESACDAVSVSRGNPVVRALARAVSSAGGRPRYTTKTGTSDLNVVLPAWRCPAAVYGPGDCALDHTPHEAIEISHLRRGADVLEAALRSLR